MDERAADNDLHAGLVQGMPVEVANRYTATWARGFEVAEVVPQGYLVRRLSDRATLPLPFTNAQLRPVLDTEPPLPARPARTA